MGFIRSRVDELPLLAFLAKSELQRRNAGSIGGIVYVFLAPLLLVIVMWAAIDYGLGMRQLVGADFGLRIIAGMVLWLAITDTVGDSVSSIVRNPHLVKKMVFPVHLLPTASVASGFTVHVAILAISCALLAIAGQLVIRPLSPAYLALGLGLQIVFALGLAYAFSALNVIVRDFQSIVPMGLSIGFWATPIIWPVDVVPHAWLWAVAVNPVAIGVEAYRVALFGVEWLFSPWHVMLAAGVAAATFAVGIAINHILRPSLGDAL